MEKTNNGKIVITGMGAVTPIGIGVDNYWKSLVEGRTGVAEITSFDTTDLPVKIAAMVKDFKPEDYMDKKLAREMEPFMQYGYVAADEALKDAGIDPLQETPVIAPERIGIVFGTVFAGITNVEDTEKGIATGAHAKTNPRFITKIIGNIGAAQIAIAKGLHGPSYTISTACSSGLDTISMGAMLLNEDLADAVICVGGEAATCPLAILGLSGTHALSQRNDDPATASRPFDAERNGFVMGEGGGAIILEKESIAKARNAKIHAELIGYANSTDGFHVTSPHPDGIGAIFCMQHSLQVAGIEPDEVDYINAHGTSTPKGDVIEVKAIKSLFKDHAYKLAVSSTKGATGHLMGAGGVTETIACIKAVEEDILPPTLNQITPDPECDLDFVPNCSRSSTVNIAMCNAFGFGGQNASLLVKKYSE
ncbi:MAG: beta-ketoacyl-ACP synthase II [Eubacterium sp.]|nr:beta-ketoacyl-ACP synthase II [Eubacterium sp.]